MRSDVVQAKPQCGCAAAEVGREFLLGVLRVGFTRPRRIYILGRASAVGVALADRAVHATMDADDASSIDSQDAGRTLVGLGATLERRSTVPTHRHYRRADRGNPNEHEKEWRPH